MSKHTPGPWFKSERPTNVNGIEYAGGCIAFTAMPRQASEEREEGESWLEMRVRTKPEQDAIKAEEAANARLIAAAPELLEALRDMLMVTTETNGCGRQHAIDGARAAIAKATGEAS